jgi:TetR/AcrR family transcriptional repressor of nem operon
MAQGVYQTRTHILETCDQAVRARVAGLEGDFAAALRLPVWTLPSAPGLALCNQVVIQGAFVLARAAQGTQAEADCPDHLRRYLELLFTQTTSRAPAAGMQPGAQ